MCLGAAEEAAAVAAEAVAAVASADALAATDDTEANAAGADSQFSRGMIEVAFSTLAAKSHVEQRSRSSKPVGVT